MKNTSTLILIFLSSLLFACSKQEPAPEPDLTTTETEDGNQAALQAALQIEPDYMREIIKEISQDSYEGRGPGSRGDDKTRAYLIDRLLELGLEPGGEDGSWEQPFDLVGVKIGRASCRERV